MYRNKKPDTNSLFTEAVCEGDSFNSLESPSFSTDEAVVLEPSARIKALADSGNAFEVDHHIPPRKYYRSGLEMVRMADVYLKEGSLENAYVLYMKFMTLFLEKIRKHPNFKSVSIVDRAQNDAKLKEVLTKAEKLKTKLLDLYEQEHKFYLERQAKIKAAMLKKFQEEQEKNRKGVFPNVTDDDKDKGVAAKENVGTRPTLLRPLSQINVALRHMMVPAKLMSKFLILSMMNTEQNKETCGILAGRLERDQLTISHLLIPKQVGTSDSCTTENEEEIFEYLDEHNLITLGWIHTHPSQTAFLSSVDLHTHCSYQLMIPEALAIVCSPKNEENGFFILTPEHGLDVVANCRQTGFHPHPTEPPLYKKAEHIAIEDLPVEIIDLRRK
ncbi:predicted protein [Pediculus humanus corporis]|uniref:Predicted protein n=1 Tax=Pediculus humanus subsp. corporis TaxID=121224 RepID=E0VIA9_PEDHC|nr:uncharacterized protein Phum_PHUM222190 [Pediculus humanus corporis]EEB13115.1 predicted protein [Pediculus humanus corporis]